MSTEAGANLQRARAAAELLGVATLAALIYAPPGFDAALTQDDALYVYAGQELARGTLPYAGVFDHKGPLGAMLAGLGVGIARLTGGDDVLLVRGMFFAVSCAAVAAVYALARALGGRLAAWLGAGAFLLFWSFGACATAGPQPKTLALLGQTLALLGIVRGRWLSAGLAAGAAALVWQPAGIFVLAAVGFGLRAARATGYAARSPWAQAALGVALPMAAITFLYAAWGELGALADGLVIFNILFIDRGDGDPAGVRLVATLGQSSGPALAVMAAGVAGLMARYGLRIQGWRGALGVDERWDPLLITFPAVLLWSLVDFQNQPDLFMHLPYLAIAGGVGAASLLARVPGLLARRTAAAAAPALLLWLAVTGAPLPEPGLTEQRLWAQELSTHLRAGDELMTLGLPAALVLTGRRNPSRYLIIKNGIDAFIAAREPHGLAGWLAALHPTLIVGDRVRGAGAPVILGWLRQHYRPVPAEGWPLAVRSRPPSATEP